jgi:hypothetical protein
MKESDYAAKERRTTRLITIAMFGGVAVVCAAIIIGRSMWHHNNALKNTGRAAGAVLVELDSGKRVIALVDDSGEQTPDRGHHRSIFRIVTVDAATGTRQQLRLIEDSFHCWAAAKNRMWCQTRHEGTMLIDATTLATIGTAEQLASALGKPYGELVALADGGVAVPFNDGRAARVDPLTTKASEIDAHTIKKSYPASATCSYAGWSKNYGFSPGPRSGLITRANDPHVPAPASAPTFLEPQILETADGGPLLIEHKVTLDKPAKQLSRIDGGKVTWTAPVDECEVMSLDAGRMVMSTIDPKQRVVALDAATGAVIWRFAM